MQQNEQIPTDSDNKLTKCHLILFHWVKVLYPTWHKNSHFRDALPSQSVG